MAKNTTKYTLPTNIAFFVYSYAKLKMLQFYFDFLCVVLPFDRFELLEMDTDSLYFAISDSSLELAVPDANRMAYEQLKRQFLVTSDAEKRTPGLFKLEWSGTGMICLCSKTYIAFTTSRDEHGNEIATNVKMSSKGLSKRTNKLTVE